MDETQQIESDIPCVVCGTNVLYLESGYHFCLECGTQKQDYQEQILEYNDDIDTKKLGHQKIHKEKEDKNAPKMSSSRMNLHSLNYILMGLTEELIVAGASPDLKNAVLRLWIKLLQEENIAFYTKNEKPPKQRRKRKCKELPEGPHRAKTIKVEDDSPDETEEYFDETIESDLKNEAMIGDDEDTNHLFGKANITRYTFYAILYMALNSINDDIQLGDLIRLARENRVSYASIQHFLPSDIKFTYICFLRHNYEYPTKKHLISYAEKLAVKLGVSQLKPPDMNKLCSRYVLELQLPEFFDFCVRRLLMKFPPHFEARIPNFEAKAMNYIVVALKMFFYLDDYSENILSDLAKKENDSTDSKPKHLFVWRDWTKFIEYRKIFIGKYHFPTMRSADQNNIDENVFISHYLNNGKDPGSMEQIDYLSGQLIDDMLTSLFSKHTNAEFANDFQCHTFPPSLTPNTTNLTILLNGNFDQNFQKDLLTENFRNQSIEYLLEQNHLSLLNSKKVAITNIAKSYEKPIFLFDVSDSKCLKANHLAAEHLNHKTIYAVGYSENSQWNNEDAQNVPYRHTKPEAKRFPKHRYPFRNSKVLNPTESSEISQDKDETQGKAQKATRSVHAKTEFEIKKPDLKRSMRGFKYLYWTKHYKSHHLRTITAFEKELDNNFPDSFGWLLRECSNIIEEHPMYLYREVMQTERMLMTFLS